MKRIIIYIITAALTLTAFSCQSFLDKQPDFGEDESAIFKSYESVLLYLDRCTFHLHRAFIRDWDGNDRSHNSQLSDECATTDNTPNTALMNSGNWLQLKRNSQYEIGVNLDAAIGRAYECIRICNRIIENYDEIPNMSDEQYRNVVGQAHFYRAWYYFELLKRYGGMPILDQVLAGDDANIPREIYEVSHEWMMEDLNIAVGNLPDYWDDDNEGRPTKLSAMAFRSMAALYNASPLMQNDLDRTVVMDYDKDKAKVAAQLAQRTIDTLNAHHYYRLVDHNEYQNIFYYSTPPWGHPEHLWYNTRRVGGEESQRIFFLNITQAKVTGSYAASLPCPTLNLINMYERQGPDGNYYPVSDPRSGYDLGNTATDTPFENRDPRFYNNFLLPGDYWGVVDGSPYQVKTWVGGDDYEKFRTNQFSNSKEFSGFQNKKFNWPEANGQTTQYGLYFYPTVFIRAAQVYLDFAEASFEATGSATAIVDGCKMSALDALNIVRQRGGITPLTADYYNDPDKFREAYRRERAVELFFENHRWWDIRRWMIAHEVLAGATPLKGMKFNPLTSTPQNDLLFSYEPFDMVVEPRVFNMRNYWYPFPQVEISANSEVKQNPGW